MWCESRPSSPIRIVCPCTDATWPNDVCHRYLKFKSVWPCSMCIHYNMLVSKPHRADLRYIHACMGFKHHDLLFKYLNSTLHWLWPHLVFYTHAVVFSYNCTTNFLSCMHAHTLPVGIIHRTHAIFFFRSVSHEGTHPHTSPSPSYRAFFISHACMHNDRCSSMYVCI